LNSYVWTFPESRLKNIDGLSDGYLCPSAEMRVDPGEIVGGGIWLLLLSSDFGVHLYGKIAVTEVSLISEGLSKDSLLLLVDRLVSFRILPSEKENWGRWALDVNALHYGIEKSNKQLDSDLAEQMTNNRFHSFAKPNISLLSDIDISPSGLPVQHQGRHVYISTLEKFAFGDLESYQQYPDCTPFGAAAIEVVKNAGLPDGVLREIRLRDEKLWFFASESMQANNETAAVPRVDVVLSPLDKNNVVTRVYMSRGRGQDSALQMQKTQTAESLHQDMLRSLVAYLNVLNMNVYQTQSVDMIVANGGELDLYELKSANLENFTRQIEEGMMQLIKYSMAFRKDGYLIGRKGLICQKIDDANLVIYAEELLAEADVSLYLYDAEYEWPRRMLNFPYFER
jgi:hypothetical protein